MSQEIRGICVQVNSCTIKQKAQCLAYELSRIETCRRAKSGNCNKDQVELNSSAFIKLKFRFKDIIPIISKKLYLNKKLLTAYFIIIKIAQDPNKQFQLKCSHS